jgi:hypothetical protein
LTQPEYVPIVATDRVRPSNRLPVPGSWYQDRPAELVDLAPPQGARLGVPGPDAGYGLKLAKRVAQRAVLAEGEVLDDAIAGCFAAGTRRAATFGRAPVIWDMEWAFRLWGFLPGAPLDLVAYRKPRFAGAAHHYQDQRKIADAVPEATLRLTPAQVAEQLDDWKRLLGR